MPESEVKIPPPSGPVGPPVLRQSAVVGAGIGAAWGILGGPPGIVGGAIVGGIIGHFWGATISRTLKKALDENE